MPLHRRHLRIGKLALAVWVASLLTPFPGRAASETELREKFRNTVRPFVESYCLNCHDQDEPKADFDLSPYLTMDAVARDHLHWQMVLEKLQEAEMPPKKSKKQPPPPLRAEVIHWIQALRKREGEKNAGDPGPVLARRLSNAEYDYTIRDLTGVDIRPTRTFPVDPANQAGFDNSGESLAMSPALVKKYLQAARHVAEHLVLKPAGFEFAPHPVVADTDRDKWAVLRIVDFYKKQPTDYADYFTAAWRFQNRAPLGKPSATLADIATESKVSPKYLTLIWTCLSQPKDEIGPIAKLQSMWTNLPEADGGTEPSSVRTACEEMRDYILTLREQIVPAVKNLSGRGIQEGSQTLVMWKNRQMAANRRRFDPSSLHLEGAALPEEPPASTNKPPNPQRRYGTNRPPETPQYIQKGGTFLAPALTTIASSATSKMAAGKKRASHPHLIIPTEADRARYEAAFARFADIFPDAFYITERARVYLNAEKEQENAGRLLSAGLHSMTGYFRDDAPLYDLVLDAAAQRELDGLWEEFDLLSSAPHRMHTSFVWFERTDSAYMRDPEFDPFRPEDKSIHTLEKIKSLAGLYLSKAIANDASEVVQQAITEHFDSVAANIQRVDSLRLASEPSHLAALAHFAERAWRRPLTSGERADLLGFYGSSRQDNGLDHEEAMRDSIVSILMSPHFSYRINLAEGPADGGRSFSKAKIVPLSNYALASRLSYFLWSSLPDPELLARAAAGDLQRPAVLIAQARRMLKEPRIRNLATEFGANWLDVRRFEEHNGVDRERFPVFNNELRQAMFEEPIRFFVDVAHNDRSILNFLYGDYTFVNAPLAAHYGMSERFMQISGLSDSSHWFRIDNANEFGRGGLLPMSVFLTASSPGLRTSPVKRGYWVARRLLGERIPPPPATVPELPADEKDLGQLTLRETLARHRENESCAGCHARFDSFGLIFEAYGPVGERRENDMAGRPVDTRAEFPNGAEGSGLEGLRTYLRAHREDNFVDNLCRKLLAYALGRTLVLSDESTIQSMRANLAAGDHRFTTLIETIITSPQFLNKRNPQYNPDLANN